VKVDVPPSSSSGAASWRASASTSAGSTASSMIVQTLRWSTEAAMTAADRESRRIVGILTARNRVVRPSPDSTGTQDGPARLVPDVSAPSIRRGAWFTWAHGFAAVLGSAQRLPRPYLCTRGFPTANRRLDEDNRFVCIKRVDFRGFGVAQ
jgi:hypothetical protein